ncbi:hypothetical protein [Candidatus Leptofilum sp.]|uniref:hypothetical protein n=1 Tax=Candidatus Leptofilum sp. TaxID=3241576 RepID=UPI003B5C666D
MTGEITFSLRPFCTLINMKAAPKSFLLRIWPQETAVATEWRFSLQPIPDGDRQGFADLLELLLYLEAITPDIETPNSGKKLSTRK